MRCPACGIPLTDKGNEILACLVCNIEYTEEYITNYWETFALCAFCSRPLLDEAGISHPFWYHLNGRIYCSEKCAKEDL